MVKRYRLGWATTAAGCFVGATIDGNFAVVGLFIAWVWALLVISCG